MKFQKVHSKTHMTVRFLDQLNLKNRRVLVRADLNVPLDANINIIDDTRISKFLPTLKYILAQGGHPILMSHLGSPDGKRDPNLSLKPIAKKISELANIDVRLVLDCFGNETENISHSIEPGQVLILENLRFHDGEGKNDQDFAEKLAKLGDVFVNDAFGTAHRKHASIVSCPRFFSEKGAGLLMQKEIEYYEKSFLKPKRPLCFVLGGAKISTKLNALVNISDKADKLLVGGAMANTFLAAQGIQMGRSLVERDFFPKVLELLGAFTRRDCKIYLPVDFVVGPSPSSKGEARTVTSLEVPTDTMALDIGPATTILFKEAIHSAETIIWNGPMGFFENDDYATGTHSMVESIASAHGTTVVGGGDTDAAIHQMALSHKIDYISTGGGAFLTLLEGKTLPGLSALEN